MHKLYKNYSLTGKNTFGIRCSADYFFEFSEASELTEFLATVDSSFPKRKFVVGTGSNLLFVDDFKGVIISPQVRGIEVLEETDDMVLVEVGAGEQWDSFVEYSVNKGWGGVENLSYIPSSVGAVPVQNIGAYGAEAGAVIDRVRGVDIVSLSQKEFSQKECMFAYRNSIFKEKYNGSFIVTSVIFKLSKSPVFNTEYGDVEKELKRLGGATLKNIREAIVSIRKSKLPDPDDIGNCGSFFKNPVVDAGFGKRLKEKYPQVPLYPNSNGVKVAAGWLIEQLGWKGKSLGNAAVHDKQALVIVNKGMATGKEIFDFSEQIRKDVLSKFDINLEREVIVLSPDPSLI
jgi:UDP-N-acetylmuramate dehydrogenase